MFGEVRRHSDQKRARAHWPRFHKPLFSHAGPRPCNRHFQYQGFRACHAPLVSILQCSASSGCLHHSFLLLSVDSVNNQRVTMSAVRPHGASGKPPSAPSTCLPCGPHPIRWHFCSPVFTSPNSGLPSVTAVTLLKESSVLPPH